MLAHVLGDAVLRPDRLPHRGQNELRVGDGRKRDEEHPAGEALDRFGRHLQREARLAGAAGPGEGEQASLPQELEQLGELALSADQLTRLGGQVRLVQAAKTRELALPELVEPHRLSEVLQPVLAQILERRTFDQLLRGLGDEDLPPVPGRTDAGGAMDVHADVALVRNGRLPRVDAHPNRELEPALRLLGRCQRVGGPGEGDEERITLCVDLYAAMTLERGT